MKPIRVLLAVLAVAVTLIAGSTLRGDAISHAAQPNPLSEPGFYVNPDSAAGQALRIYPQSAAALRVLAGTPQFQWFTENDPVTSIGSYVDAASAVGKRALITLYAIPHRDCNGYSSGGFATGAQYLAWVGAVAAQIGSRPAAVILEPDALASAGCLSATEQTERYGLLRSAATILSRLQGTVTYIDGGHSQWLSPQELAQRLRLAGVDMVRGFSLNVSNFFRTGTEVAYGEQVAALLGGHAHYVIDTSRNGTGPAPAGPLNWCNPPGRAIGAAPTTSTTGAHDDAYLWIKNPGQSDGDCGRGDPRSGLWFNSYAVALVQNAGR